MGKDAGVCVVCESSFRKSDITLASLEETGLPPNQGGSGPALLRPSWGVEFPDGRFTSGSRRGKGWNQRRGDEGLQELWLRTVLGGMLLLAGIRNPNQPAEPQGEYTGSRSQGCVPGTQATPPTVLLSTWEERWPLARSGWLHPSRASLWSEGWGIP